MKGLGSPEYWWSPCVTDQETPVPLGHSFPESLPGSLPRGSFQRQIKAEADGLGMRSHQVNYNCFVYVGGARRAAGLLGFATAPGHARGVFLHPRPARGLPFGDSLGKLVSTRVQLEKNPKGS